MTELMATAGVAPREKFTTIYSGMDVEPFLRADEHRGAFVITGVEQAHQSCPRRGVRQGGVGIAARGQRLGCRDHLGEGARQHRALALGDVPGLCRRREDGADLVGRGGGEQLLWGTVAGKRLRDVVNDQNRDLCGCHLR